jgi:hypothetical protein
MPGRLFRRAGAVRSDYMEEKKTKTDGVNPGKRSEPKTGQCAFDTDLTV